MHFAFCGMIFSLLHASYYMLQSIYISVQGILFQITIILNYYPELSECIFALHKFSTGILSERVFWPPGSSSTDTGAMGILLHIHMSLIKGPRQRCHNIVNKNYYINNRTFEQTLSLILKGRIVIKRNIGIISSPSIELKCFKLSGISGKSIPFDILYIHNILLECSFWQSHFSKLYKIFNFHLQREIVAFQRMRKQHSRDLDNPPTNTYFGKILLYILKINSSEIHQPDTIISFYNIIVSC